MKNSGLNLERHFSHSFHASGTPVLVSSQLLRLRNLGQLDLVCLEKKRGAWILRVGEVKASLVGIEGMERSQRRRIQGARYFLAGLMGVSTQLEHLYQAEEEEE